MTDELTPITPQELEAIRSQTKDASPDQYAEGVNARAAEVAGKDASLAVDGAELRESTAQLIPTIKPEDVLQQLPAQAPPAFDAGSMLPPQFAPPQDQSAQLAALQQQLAALQQQAAAPTYSPPPAYAPSPPPAYTPPPFGGGTIPAHQAVTRGQGSEGPLVEYAADVVQNLFRLLRAKGMHANSHELMLANNFLAHVGRQRLH